MKAIVLAATALTVMAAAGATLYHEKWRLQYHFSPAQTWTNDPNGLVWYKGEYHLFYQNNPFGNEWGHMSWGHAVSPDLLHWKELPVAIPEEHGVLIYSGSVVIDSNTSGLCRASADTSPETKGAGAKTAAPKDNSCLVALYTGDSRDHTLETQNLAYSNDRGRTWTKYSGNPVVDLHMKDFRDPKILWYPATKRWIMVVALPNEHKVRLFSSPNLLKWTQLSDFGPAGATGGQWECPDLFALGADTKPPGLKWVFVVNVNPGGVQGGSATQYFIGNFDGRKFQNANSPDKTLWVDWGKDFYAATTYFNAPPHDPRKFMLAWFGNWQYAKDEPTRPQRGAMTIPRQILLRNKPEGVRLIQEPVNEMALLHGTELGMRNREIDSVNHDLNTEGFHGHEMEIQVLLDPGTSEEAGLLVHKGGNERTVVGVTKSGQAFIDRTHSGEILGRDFTGRQNAPLRSSGPVMIHILLDRSSVEAFFNDGETVISDRVFPAPASDGVEFYSKGGSAKILSLRMWKLRSVWP